QCLRIAQGLKLADAGDVCAGSDSVAQRCGVVLDRRIAAAVCVERGRGEVSRSATEGRDGDATKNIPVTTTVTNQHALAEHEYDAAEVRVALQRQGSGHDEHSRAARKRAI